MLKPAKEVILFQILLLVMIFNLNFQQTFKKCNVKFQVSCLSYVELATDAECVSLFFTNDLLFSPCPNNIFATLNLTP